MTSKHTPGPWFVTDHRTKYVESRLPSGMIQEIAAVGPTAADNGYGEQQAANARLIAAAPELLEKLQQLLSAYEQADHRAGYCCCGDDMERHGDPMGCGHIPVDAGEYAADNVIRDVKALIAKATGGAE